MKATDIKVGDKVKFRRDLKAGERYRIYLMNEMLDLIKKHNYTGIVNSVPRREENTQTISLEGYEGYLFSTEMLDLRGYKPRFSRKDDYSVRFRFGENSEPLLSDVKVIINEPAVIVILEDGSKGVAKCMPGDTFDENVGVLLALGRAFEMQHSRKTSLKRCMS